MTRSRQPAHTTSEPERRVTRARRSCRAVTTPISILGCMILAVLIFTGCRLERAADPRGPDTSGPVKLASDAGPYFVGSFHRVSVRLPIGMTLEDLDFVVQGGPAAGQVSLSKEQRESRRPEVMLLVGWRPGDYVLEARGAADDQVLATLPFAVRTSWKNESRGPGIWFNGEPSGGAQASAWGNGPDSPQNIEVIPASGERSVALVLVDTSSQRYTAAESAATQTAWLNDAVNGVSIGGTTRSVATWFSEVSYGEFTITAQAFGPYQLPGDFNTYINADGSETGAYFQAAITAADGDIDYSAFDSVVLVSRSIDGGGSAWPRATIGDGGPYTTAEGDMSLGVVSMPFDWTARDGRHVHETLAHELCHNLGLADQYQPKVGSRNVGEWDMMHGDGRFPHLSAPHRMMLGWVDETWIEPLSFGSMPVPVDETIRLRAIETGAPPASERSVIEVRKADGWNYYFEYRNPQAGQIGDQEMTTPSRVLGLDATSAPWTPPTSRPFLLLLPDDSDGDGAVLAAGGDYRERDPDPSTPMDFQIDVTAIAGNTADVRVRWDVIGRPDPSIRPWPASADRRYQSPDIEVRNAKNAVDATLFNIPWAENPNTVVASVRNRGDIDAPGVRVDFSVMDLTAGKGPKTPLGGETLDIPSQSTVEFTASETWNPPADGHFCIHVRIPLYQTPLTPSKPSVVEMTELNNSAQSNYTQFISATASPGTRAVGEVVVTNPYQQRTRVWLVGRQDNPWYRTYLGHRWVELDPGELLRVPVMFEFVDALPTRGPYRDVNARLRRLRSRHNSAEVIAFIEDPRPPRVHTADEYGGVQARVVHGRETRIDLQTTRTSVTGCVSVTRGGGSVPGRVIIGVEAPCIGTEVGGYQVVALSEGTFEAQLPRDWEVVHVTYLPRVGFAESAASAKR